MGYETDLAQSGETFLDFTNNGFDDRVHPPRAHVEGVVVLSLFWRLVVRDLVIFGLACTGIPGVNLARWNVAMRLSCSRSPSCITSTYFKSSPSGTSTKKLALEAHEHALWRRRCRFLRAQSLKIRNVRPTLKIISSGLSSCRILYDCPNSTSSSLCLSVIRGIY